MKAIKKKKGFTLAEILGVIVILGLLVLLLAPGLINRIRSNSKEAESAGNEIVYTAAHQHINNNKNVYPSGNSYCISISTLISEGRLVRPVINVITGENIENKTVLAKIYRTDLIDFSIKDSDRCEAEKEKPIRTATITFAKGSNTSAIGTTATKTCIINEATNNCTVTAPTITPNEGYSASNWSTTNGATTGIAPGGNITITRNVTYYGNSIDNIKPTVALSPNTQSDYIRGGKAVTVTVSDKGSKIPAKSTLSYAWSTSATTAPTSWTNVTTTNTAVAASATASVPTTATSSLTGSYYLWVKAGIKDVAGNASLKATSSVFKFDNTAPTFSSLTNPSSGNWTKSNVAVTLKGSDAHSGINTWQYITMPQVKVKGHVQNIGWYTEAVSSTIGTTGIGMRLEAFTIKIVNSSISGGISYSANNGSFVSDGATAGQTGVSNIIKTIKIKLTGDLATNFNVKYRTHRANVGWKDDEWVTNGTATKNDGNRVEAIEIKIEPKSTITSANVWKSASNGNTSYTYTFSSEQNTTNYFRLCDKVGNCSAAKSTTIKIDKTTPMHMFTAFNVYTDGVSVKSNNCNYKYTPTAGSTTSCETVTTGHLHFSYEDACFDNLSGCKATENKYIHNGGGTQYSNWTAGSKINWSGGSGSNVGTYRKIYTRETDNAGNVSGTLYTYLHW